MNSLSAYPIAISKIFQDPFISLFNAHFSLNIAHTARDGAPPNSADSSSQAAPQTVVQCSL
jgi:hypothetical protein